MDYERPVNHNIIDLTLLANQNNARIANQEKRKRKKNKGKKNSMQVGQINQRKFKPNLGIELQSQSTNSTSDNSHL